MTHEPETDNNSDLRNTTLLFMMGLPLYNKSRRQAILVYVVENASMKSWKEGVVEYIRDKQDLIQLLRRYRKKKLIDATNRQNLE